MVLNSVALPFIENFHLQSHIFTLIRTEGRGEKISPLGQNLNYNFYRDLL